MTKFIKLPDNSYVNLNNAVSFSIENSTALVEKPCIRKILFWKFKDFELKKISTCVFVVNGEVIYEADKNNEEEMRIIQNIQGCINGFIRKS